MNECIIKLSTSSLKQTKSIKKLRHYIEYAPLWLIYKLCRKLSFSTVSQIGGYIGKFTGYFYPFFCNVADKNLQRAFPELNLSQRRAIIRNASENFGRTFLEYFVMDKLVDDCKCSIESINFLSAENCLKNRQPLIFVSAHLGNWEVGALEMSRRGLPLIPVYRHINNSFLDQLILKCREPYVVTQIPKGDQAGFKCLKFLKRGFPLVFLGDQKYNKGPEIPFFNHLARTADGVARLAQTTGAMIVPVRIVRENKFHFRIIADDFIDATDSNQTVENILTQVNQRIESWIRQNPEQWFWFHRRWDKAYYK